MKSNSSKTTWDFQDLMQYRIHEILLIASPYDAFILEQDGKLTEQILSEYIGMNLSYAPRVWNASTGVTAFNMLDSRTYDLIIIMMRISDINSITLGKKLRKKYPKIPLVLFAFDESEVQRISSLQKNIFDKIFIWTGNANIFPAIIKCIEDKKNISKDIRTADIRSIILVEDTPKYYSKILPVLYKEIIYHTKQLIDKSLNDTQKLLHMRGRPKILLATNFEEAIFLYKKYNLNILGIITDLKFPIKNKINNKAGFELIKEIRYSDKSIPILLQTTKKINQEHISKYNFSYINKNSPKLFKELRMFMIENFGFGFFNFRLPNNKIIDTASNIDELYNKLKKISKESLYFHAINNHLSNWLAARGEFKLASEFRSIKTEDFEDIENRREYHLKLLKKSIDHSDPSIIAEFSESTIIGDNHFIRIGNGSLGGKARGLAFSSKLMLNKNFKNEFKDIKIKIPKIIVITTSEFDQFMDENNLWDIALTSNDNKLIEKQFINSSLNQNLIKKLKIILKNISYPLAVRSSGLLEDSQYNPFAGMYSTFMLPNSNKSIKIRLEHLCEAVKRIYASTFFKESKSLMDSVNHRYEEEKMAIILMELIGSKHNNKFYPTISGVFQSYNYYPVSYMDRKDGIGFLALGLGKTIAEGGKSLRFCPKYPNILPQFYSVKSSINSSQNSFFALEINENKNPIKDGESKNLKEFNLDIAEEDNQLNYIASVITDNDNIVRDSLKYNGIRILTFAPILKFNYFPLSKILQKISKAGSRLVGAPIEIEFAINLNESENVFSLLQIKPMPVESSNDKLNLNQITELNNEFCFSKQTLGNGIQSNISHIIYINIDDFKREKTKEISEIIGKFNKKLGSKNSYVLMGPGRWGSLDPWLGIPIDWEQITNAKSIIEIGIDSFNPDPSFGSHFFQNLTSLRIGYFTIEKKLYKNNIDWNWLKKQKHIYTEDCVNVVKLNKPLHIKLDGINGQGIIYKNNKKNESMNEEESTGI